MSTPVIERSDVELSNLDIFQDLLPFEEPTDKNARAHIVNPPKNKHIWEPGMTARELVDIARATQQEIISLCGHRFTPKHDPDKLDVCDECMQIAQQIIAGA